jgi:NAD(P)-dependent dehydrogenase (short-subunit alcohol dehydrogenase family)
MQSLAGKTVLITGGAGAVGQACLTACLREGARVMLSDRAAPQGLDRPDVAVHAADITRKPEVEALFDTTARRFGPVDAVVLAAGVEGVAAPVEEITEAEIDAALAVNVKGVLFGVQAALGQMRPRGRGAIVALSSISGVIGSAQLAAYTLTKHAVIGLVRATALECGRDGVRINAVCPGPIESPMMRRLDAALSARTPSRAAGQADAARALPTGRYVTAAEVADMTCFLLSDAAGSCHGGTYMVDGGFTAK